MSMHFLRKNQKAIMAVSGVLIILVFTVGGALQQYLSQNPNSGAFNTTVVSWKGGNIDEQEMMRLVSAHNLANQAVRSIAADAIQKGAEPHGLGVSPYEGSFGIVSDLSENAVFRVMMLADKARSMGLTVNDDAVKQYLNKLSGGQLKEGDLKRIIQDTLGERMSLTQFFEQMKTELLAQNMLFLAQTGIYALPPSEAYEYFERLNRSAQVETMPVKVEDFIDQVSGTPTQRELQELYDKHKNSLSHPEFAEPGFRVPRQIAIEFVKVDFGKLVDEEKAKITEEQVKAEYEKRIAAGDFKVPVLPEIPHSTDEPKTDEPKTEEPKTDEPKTDEPKTEEPKTEEPKTEEPKTEEPKTEEPKTDEPKTDEPKTDEGQVSAVICVVKDEPAVPAATDDKPEPAAPEDKSTDKPAEPTTEEPAVDPKPEEKPATDPATDPATEPMKPDATQPVAEEPQFQPLEKVRDQILTSLAREPAQKRMDEAFAAVRKAVVAHGRVTRSARTEYNRDKKNPAPDEFALAKVAKDAGLQFDSIPLINQFDIEKDHEIGRASASAAGQFGRSLPFVMSAFNPKRDVYVPEQVNALFSQMEYLYWLTDAKDEFLPPFKDCEKEVAKAWKVLEARKLAKAEAERLAKEVASGKTLKESFVDRAVNETSMFTWFTQGFTPYGMGQPQLSEVKGVGMAGMKFMEVVFSLKPGETGVAPNQPETIYYVVQLQKTAPGNDLLRELFAGGSAQRSMPTIQALWRKERQPIMSQWMDDLDKEYSVEWKRDPRQPDNES